MAAMILVAAFGWGKKEGGWGKSSELCKGTDLEKGHWKPSTYLMRSHVDFGQHGNQKCPRRYNTDYGEM